VENGLLELVLNQEISVEEAFEDLNLSIRTLNIYYEFSPPPLGDSPGWRPETLEA
jgi:hypothetical protein